MTTAEKSFAVYAQRNTGPILEVLDREFRDCTNILEIGSGTGQHAVAFAAAMPHLCWQTSDVDENHAGIRSWIEESGTPNVLPPLFIDVRSASIGAGQYDAAYSANTAHIMSFEAVGAMFALVGQALRPQGRFCLYGPFKLDGNFTTQSNADFDRSLRSRDSLMGIRDLEALDVIAGRCKLQRLRLYAMPANNLMAVWRKNGQVDSCA